MRRLLLTAGCLMLMRSPVPAQESDKTGEKAREAGGVTEHGTGEMVWGWANFVLLAAGLGYVIRKNAGPYFAHRSLEIRKGIVEADAARAESDAKVAEVDRRLANLQQEIEALRESASQEAKAEAARVRREADAEMAKVETHLTEEIAAAAKSARLELRRYSAELALRLAEQKIAARLTPEAEDRLVTSFVAGMAAKL